MSGLPSVNGMGRLGADPELRFTPAGKAVANVNVVSQDRKRLPSGEYEDGATVWLRLNVWGDDAERLVEACAKGDLVMYSGELEGRPWEDNQGQQRTSFELRFARVALLRKKGSGRQQPPPPQDPWATPLGQAARADDPWSSGPGGLPASASNRDAWAPRDDEPPF